MQDTTQTAGKWELDPQAAPAEKRKPAPPTENRHAVAARKRQEKRDKENTFYVPSEPASPEETEFRHAHWKDKRKRVLQALRDAATGRTTIENFENCGSDCAVEYDQKTQKYRLRANFCKNRHCEPCMKAKANLLTANLQDILEDNTEKQFRFITLTLKHSTEDLGDQLDRLNACFKKLRNSEVWKETQEGGAAMLEVKYNQDTGEWHPHLHIIAEGFFLHHRNLSEAWHKITGDSFRVDVRSIDSAKDASYYVAKYVSKGTNNEVWYTPHIAVEWVTTMRGRRTCTTYGSWRGIKLLAPLEKTGNFVHVARLTEVVRSANRGEQWAISCLDAIKRDLQYNPNRPRKPKAGTLLIEPT